MLNTSAWAVAVVAVVAARHMRVAAGVAVVECSPAPDSP
jgi:hypothetical protein